MKKNLIYMGMGAMALVTPLLLSSCSSDDPSGQVAPTPTGETVKTSFTLSVGLPKGNGSNGAKGNFGTRMTDAVAQAQDAPEFRGMDNMTLIPFTTGEAIKSSDTRAGSSNINLPNATANTLTQGQLTQTGNAHVYTDVSVPVGVSSFLFYGKAVDATAGTDASTAPEMFKYGSLTTAGLSAGAPSGISFTPKQIYSTNAVDAKATSIVEYLNKIASTSYTDNSKTPAEEHKWSAVTADAQGQGSALATLYKNFTSLSAGSSTSVQAAVQELYTSLNSLLSGNQTETNKGIINKIIDNIKTGATVGTDGTVALNADYTGFPENINLPDGAVTVKCTDGTFAAQTSVTYTSSGTQVAALSDYVYPANLWYRANTLIKTSDKVLTEKYVDGTAWDAILANYDGDGVVKNSTASIALKDQIQYAVGRLSMTVKVADGTLYDGNGETVTVPTEGFPVSAVLIGDQRKVDFQFAPVSKGDKQYTIYDKELTGINAKTTASTANNTLALETPEDENVNVLLELTNNTGKRFKGKDGYVPAGGKFYLLGTLKPGDVTVGGQASTTLKQVFKQDYVTTANFTIQANIKDDTSNPNHDKGLGAAYNVIPDLRTPALSIGLSVDLTWQSGLTFDIDI
jgi:hypothetical protein